MTMRMRWWFIAVFLLAAGAAQAHKLAPSLLELREREDGAFDVAWKTPRFSSTPVPQVPRLPAGCSDLTDRSAREEGTGVRLAWQVRCDAPLVGAELRVDGLAENQSAALLRVEWADGATAQGLVDGARPAWRIPDRPGALRIGFDYARLGVEHILGGIDHLLFVLGLLLLVKGHARLFWTITAFTAGHSVTLALATLGLLDYPVDAIEFLIALSIFVIAVELTREPDEKHWLRHRPWLAAGLFGLLHGMGFAGALREVGLPGHEIPLALLAFNLGIEAGQIAFVVVALAVGALWRRTAWTGQGAWRLVPVYVIGVLSAYWCIERGLATLAAT